MLSILAELSYELKPVEKGYANRTLYINLTTHEIKIKPVNEEMKEKFVGGKGFDLWLMWNSLPKNRPTNWDDTENVICIASGPLGGSTFYPGSGKSIVTTISPLTGIVIDSNVGGYFGPYAKFSGFDAVEIQGKASKDVVIFINGDEGVVRVEEAENIPDESHLLTQQLTEQYAVDSTDKEKIRVSVVSTGNGAKHTKWGCLNFSWFNRKRDWASYKQAGRGGIGTVFRDKRIKALVCRSPKADAKINDPSNSDMAKNVGKKHNREIIENDPKQNEMRVVGTGHLPEIMQEYDLLPTENFRFGSHKNKELKPEDFPYTREIMRKIYTHTGKGTDGCWIGCTIACSHISKGHKVLTGSFKGQEVNVDGPEYETIAGCGSNWGVWDPIWVLETNFYCDTYGLDTISVGTGIAFVMECFEAGVLNKEITGGLELNFGNAEAALELIHQMARGEGFGAVVGQGIVGMKKIFPERYGADPQFLQDIGMEHKGLEFSEYVTKESLAQQGGYGLTLKGPQHDEAWLIFEDMVRNNLPTFEDKAEALAWFPFWRTWFGLNGLCKLPWNDVVPPDNTGNPLKPLTLPDARAKIPKHVNWYAEYFSGVTGRTSSPDDLIKMSERVYNFQRILNVRQGKGLRESDSNLPYRAMGPVTKEEYESRTNRYDKQLKEEIGEDPSGKTTEEKMVLIRNYREERYKKLQDAVYERRGWSVQGCPSIAKIKELGIDYEDVLSTISPHQ